MSSCNGYFPGGPGSAGIRMSPFWILLELMMMEVVSGNNWSYKVCKAPDTSSSPTNQHQVSFTSQCPSCHPTNCVGVLRGRSTEGKASLIESWNYSSLSGIIPPSAGSLAVFCGCTINGLSKHSRVSRLRELRSDPGSGFGFMLNRLGFGTS